MSSNKSRTIKSYFKKQDFSSTSNSSSPPVEKPASENSCDKQGDNTPILPENTDPGTSTDKVQTGKEAKKTIVQKFKPEWTASEGFSCFQRYEIDPSYAWCKICLEKLSIARGGKSNLSSHLLTKRHQEASARILADSVAKIDEFTMKNDVTQAEMKICGWAIENNVSFNAVEKLADVLKSLDPQSKVFTKLKLGRTKVAAVVNGVFAEVQHEDLVRRMKNSNFSLIIDESTDIGAVKTLAMVIRILEDDGGETFKIRDYFYKAVELHLADHKTIYQAIVKQFEEDGIDYKSRLIGFGSDGASVMMGPEKSVMRLFKNDCPSLIVIKCTCHSLALCASYACEKLPSYLEQLMRDIYSYLSCSPKRSKEFEMIQSILELKPLKALHPSATRWLSLEAVVKRNIERFSELLMFFSFQSTCDNNGTASRILHHLKDPMTKPLLLFLDYVLPLINRVNRIFQSESPEFPSLYSEIKSLIMMLLDNLCEERYMKTLSLSNISGFEQHLKDKRKIYVGLAADAAVNDGSLDESRSKTFYDVCCNFYIELIKQLLKRFDLDDSVLKTSALVDPRNLGNLRDLSQVIKEFPHFFEDGKQQELENEYKQMRLTVIREELNLEEKDNTETRWRKILDCRRADGKLAFPELRKFIANFLVIPHSSAAVERVFSQYNLNKTRVRNRLNTNSMDCILRAKCLIKCKGGTETMKLSKDFRAKFNKSMYSHHN